MFWESVVEEIKHNIYARQFFLCLQRI